MRDIAQREDRCHTYSEVCRHCPGMNRQLRHDALPGLTIYMTKDGKGRSGRLGVVVGFKAREWQIGGSEWYCRLCYVTSSLLLLLHEFFAGGFDRYGQPDLCLLL